MKQDIAMNQSLILLTHYQTKEGWKVEKHPEEIICDKLVHLGYCAVDGDIFAAYEANTIRIFKGHLNNETYKQSI